MTEAEFTSASFYRYLEEKKLVGVRCKKCQAFYLPPRQICLHCHSRDVEWVELSGEGKLLTFTTIAVGTSSMVARGYDRNRQYCCGIVELDEGPRVCAFIIGVDAQKPDDIKIGRPVKVESTDSTDKPSLLTFRALRG